VFSAIWSLGSTINQESRDKFDVFFRELLRGRNEEYPRPKGFKLNKNQLFPEKGSVFDYICDKRSNQWIPCLIHLIENIQKFNQMQR